MSFYHALEGILAAVRTEAHLRFHTAVAVLITIFAAFYGLTRAEWAVLAVTIGTVISAELMNTAVERAVDTATSEKVPSAKVAKDAAAGGVLVSAAVSVAVGICLFGDVSRIWDTLGKIFASPTAAVPCIIVGIAAAAFVCRFGKKKGKDDGK